MAYIDDRAWCHPKLTDLPKATRWVWASSIMYASGFGTRGVLTRGQQEQIGSTPAVRKQLVAARLWDMNGDGETIHVHDWDDYNGKRDERRRKDRERKRNERRNG
jgi:hypothetical protein